MSALLSCRGFTFPALLSRSLVPRRHISVKLQPRPALKQRTARLRMGAAFSASADFTSMIKQKNSENPVMVYSKTYCPYCSEVKGLFSRLNVPHKVVELDELADGDAVQAALRDVTGRSTVPQVFVGGKHVGGCDDTVAAYNSGKLKELMQAAGISI